ncbi:hypothetical protein AAMO2058_000480900 [Amorphochlora amoebiformis]
MSFFSVSRALRVVEAVGRRSSGARGGCGFGFRYGKCTMAGHRRGFLTSILSGASGSQGSFHREKRSKVIEAPVEIVSSVVADVASYQHFLPYINQSQIISPVEESDGIFTFTADLQVGFTLWSDQFRSLVEVSPEKYVIARCGESEVMRDMNTLWTFNKRGDEATEVFFSVNLQIMDPLMANTIAALFSTMADAQMEAFQAEILSRYSKSIRPHMATAS